MTAQNQTEEICLFPWRDEVDSVHVQRLYVAGCLWLGEGLQPSCLACIAFQKLLLDGHYVMQNVGLDEPDLDRFSGALLLINHHS